MTKRHNIAGTRSIPCLRTPSCVTGLAHARLITRMCVGPCRYEHAAVLLDGKMYVVAGNCRGKFLGDVHELDLATLAWSRVDGEASAAPTPSSTPVSAAASPLQTPAAGALPHCAGASLVAYDGRLVLVGGHSKVNAGEEGSGKLSRSCLSAAPGFSVGKGVLA